MKPRNLRHRLEKTAKLLVVVQKRMPDVSCQFADDKGEYGHLMLRLPLGGDPSKLGKELESKGFVFTKTRNPWLGTMTYRGSKEEQPDIIIEIEIHADRLNPSVEIAPEAFSFREAT
ncbi:MAG: hypothetical protein AAGA45_01310 [Verrucomicrobiota bacterium]